MLRTGPNMKPIEVMVALGSRLTGFAHVYLPPLILLLLLSGMEKKKVNEQIRKCAGEQSDGLDQSKNQRLAHLMP